MVKSHSIKQEIKNQTNNGNERKSTRLARKEQINYKELNEGEKPIESAGTSEVAKHIIDMDITKQIWNYQYWDTRATGRKEG